MVGIDGLRRKIGLRRFGKFERKLSRRTPKWAELSKRKFKWTQRFDCDGCLNLASLSKLAGLQSANFVFEVNRKSMFPYSENQSFRNAIDSISTNVYKLDVVDTINTQ